MYDSFTALNLGFRRETASAFTHRFEKRTVRKSRAYSWDTSNSWKKNRSDHRFTRDRQPCSKKVRGGWGRSDVWGELPEAQVELDCRGKCLHQTLLLAPCGRPQPHQPPFATTGTSNAASIMSMSIRSNTGWANESAIGPGRHSIVT